MRVLVTGGTGKLGNAVARRLAERGDEVVALVRDEATSPTLPWSAAQQRAPRR